MKAVEASAKTREEAIQNALKELGVEMYEVDKIEVIDEGSKGLFGLGARPVRVRLVVENMPDEPQRSAEPSGGDRPRRENNRNRGGKDRERGEKRESRNGRGPRAERDSSEKPAREGGRGRGRDRKPKAERDAATPDKPAETQAKQEGRRGRGERSDRSDRKRERDQRIAQNRSDKPTEKNEDRPEPRPESKPEPAQEADIPKNANSDEQALVDAVAPITDEQGNEAAAVLEEIIAKMGIEAKATFVRPDDGSARINVSSEDSAILIGRKGRNLSAMQYLINRMVSRGDTNENTERIVVDVEGYVDRRRESLQEMALSMAAKAKDTQRNMRLKPLSPQERRIIHLTLQDDEDVRTFSLGESLFRSVVISPKNATRPERPRQGRGNRGGRRRGGRGRSNGGGGQGRRKESQDIDVGAFGD